MNSITELMEVLTPKIQRLIEGYFAKVLINTSPTTGDAAIELGVNRTGNRVCYIDFHADDTYTDYALRILRSSTGTNAPSSIIHRGTGDFTLLTNEAGRIVFSTNNSLAAYLDTSQRFISKSGIIWLKRDLTNDANRKNWGFNTEVLAVGDLCILNSTTNTGDPTNVRIAISNNGNMGIGLSPSFRIHLDADSAGKPSTNVWTVTSDSRTKRNVKKYFNGLSDILALPDPVSFEYNGKGNTPDGAKGVGFNAQDVQGVKSDWVKPFTVQENNQDVEYLGLNTGDLTFMLVNAVKELNTTIQAQAATIKDLQQRITVLEGKVR